MLNIIDIGQLATTVTLIITLIKFSKSTKKEDAAKIEENYDYRKKTDKALEKTDQLEENHKDMKKLFYEIKETIDGIKLDVSEIRALRENVINFEVIKADCVGELLELHKNDSERMKELYGQFNIAKREVYTSTSHYKK